MAEKETQDTATVKKEMEETVVAPDIESQVKDAMRSRVNHFKEQADSLTFEGVRRLLEKDLGLEKFALDVHKRFVKQCLFECLEGAAVDNASKDSGEVGDKDVLSMKREERVLPEGNESKANVKESGSEDEEKMEDSPVMGLLTGKKTTKSETQRTKVNDAKDVLSESSIKKALLKRASYIKANSEKLTVAGLRRLLEEDLKLDKNALEPFKKFINKQLDEVINSCEVSTPKEKNLKKNSRSKASKNLSSESSGSLDEDSDEEDEEERKVVPKPKMLNAKDFKKRKRPEKETKVSGKKQVKRVEKVAENNSDAEDGGNASGDSHSQSSGDKPVKKKEASSPAYGKRVEHLKSVIKSCGMSVPPAVYKKVKQVPENKREAQLIKELEEILSREGLSSNPSEKEIKEVKKRKVRAKELEGIDTSNIVSSSRRRSTASYVAPPMPKVAVESEGDDADNMDEEDEDEDDDDDDDDDEQNQDDNDGDNDEDDESQSEDSDDWHDEDSE